MSPAEAVSPQPKPTADSKPKFCRDCEFLLGIRSRTDDADKWKCIAPENIKGTVVELVSGEERTILHHEFCSYAREDAHACSPAGRWFKLYERPQKSASVAKPIDLNLDSLDVEI